MRPRGQWLGAWAAGLLSAALGCATSRVPPSDPLSAAERILRAAASGDEHAVWASLDEESRAIPSAREQLRRILQDHRDELRQRLATLQRRVASVRLRVGRPGSELLLVRKAGSERWRLAGGWLAVLAPPSSPQQAIAALRDALQRMLDSGLFELVDTDRTDAWRAEAERLLEETADPLDWIVDERGGRATVYTSSGRPIELRREQRGWIVVQIGAPP